jgi:hypothetical protein
LRRFCLLALIRRARSDEAIARPGRQTFSHDSMPLSAELLNEIHNANEGEKSHGIKFGLWR